MTPLSSENMIVDVPSPIDLRNLDHAREWARQAMAARPWRLEFFAQFHEQLSQCGASRVLELGSGPGFLASYLLRADPTYAYTALDFSAAMHQLAQERLEGDSARVHWIERSFREPNWNAGLGPFDAVITHQAVHELRHKAHALALHRQVRRVLTPEGVYLVCDHFVGEGGMKNDQLYMTVEEQHAALLEAGFDDVSIVLLKGGLVLHRAAFRASSPALL